jgi:puromycin-sensitive aminopeptidase
MHDASAATGEAAYRLPRTALPRRYDLRIEPDLGAATFVGREDVAVEITEPVRAIVLNAAELAIDEAWLVAADGTRREVVASLDAAGERLTLALDDELAPGAWTVHLGFRGTLNDKLKGFYRSVFTDADGAERVIGTTQMEPTDARLAFPCWDEPDLKAVFAVTLVVDDGLLAVSNAAEIARTTLDDGRVEIRFADTIPMSTYLVAFVVGPLEATEPVDVDGTPLRVVHVPGKGGLAPFSLDVGAFALRLFADYYEIPYPGDKCDFIALPDFAAGAMENLGAITYREAVLLVDPEAATQTELQRVADVVSHELAHMWFGDLVTMKWWNGLWLNEAFATFMELAAVDAYRPEWQRWVAFTNERAAAFAIDSLESTRPIEFPVHSPEEAEGMFDLLTYQKGASVLRMLEQFLGHDGFRDGIRLYLRSRQFGNAETTDLWDAIEEATGEPVRRIMDTWIFQGGHPVLSVTADGDRLTLTQRRFRFLPDDGEATWAVPVLVAAPGGAPQKVLLDTTSTTVDLPGASSGVVVNAGGHGFYRVAYSPALLAALGDRLGELAPVERALLLDDTWAAVLAGTTPATAFLDLAAGFGDETDPAVWTTLSGALGSIERILDGEARTRFQAWVRALGRPALEKLGWEPAFGESELLGQTRQLVLGVMGGIGDDADVQARARRVLDRALAGQGVDPNVAAAAVTIVAGVGTEADWDRYVEVFRTTESPQEQLRYLYGLAGFPSEALAGRTLAMTLDEIRSQNAPFVIFHLLANREVNAAAWAWVKANWDAMVERFPDNTIPRLLGGVVTLSTPEQAADVEAFVAAHPVPQATKTVEQHLERLKVNVGLRQREAARVADHLR